jgi:3-oxoacyl-[acyl-carrier protein] reductase
MEISLSGRAAIVTGGSKGLGFAMAARFAASGADVAIVARTGETLEEAVAAISKSSRSVRSVAVDPAGRAPNERKTLGPHHQRA